MRIGRVGCFLEGPIYVLNGRMGCGKGSLGKGKLKFPPPPPERRRLTGDGRFNCFTERLVCLFIGFSAHF